MALNAARAAVWIFFVDAASNCAGQKYSVAPAVYLFGNQAGHSWGGLPRAAGLVRRDMPTVTSRPIIFSSMSACESKRKVSVRAAPQSATRSNHLKANARALAHGFQDVQAVANPWASLHRLNPRRGNRAVGTSAARNFCLLKTLSKATRLASASQPVYGMSSSSSNFWMVPSSPISSVQREKNPCVSDDRVQPGSLGSSSLNLVAEGTEGLGHGLASAQGHLALRRRDRPNMTVICKLFDITKILIANDFDFRFQFDSPFITRALTDDFDQFPAHPWRWRGPDCDKIPVLVRDHGIADMRAFQTEFVNQPTCGDGARIFENAAGARRGGLRFPAFSR